MTATQKKSTKKTNTKRKASKSSTPTTPTISSLDPKVAAVIACPACVSQDDDSLGQLIEKPINWLVCQTSGCTYPIVDGIPVLLVEVGKAFAKTPVSKLPKQPTQEDVASWTK